MQATIESYTRRSVDLIDVSLETGFGEVVPRTAERARDVCGTGIVSAAGRVSALLATGGGRLQFLDGVRLLTVDPERPRVKLLRVGLLNVFYLRAVEGTVVRAYATKFLEILHDPTFDDLDEEGADFYLFVQRTLAFRARRECALTKWSPETRGFGIR